MHKETRELIAWAETIGFTCDGLDGHGHYILTHENGRTTIAATPSDYRGRRNAESVLRKIAGAAHAGPNSGHHRKRVSRGDPVRHLASDKEVAAATHVRGLLAEHQSLSRLFQKVQDGTATQSERDRTVPAVSRILAIRAELDRLGVDVPRIDIRGFSQGVTVPTYIWAGSDQPPTSKEKKQHAIEP